MDQIKIGRFIALCRKKSGLTQMQLAERLGITDKAISKWETGKYQNKTIKTTADGFFYRRRPLISYYRVFFTVITDNFSEMLMSEIIFYITDIHIEAC